MERLRIADGQAFNVLGSRIPDWSGWLASFVVDNTGRYLGADGTSKTISNHLDLQLLLALRSKCSVIVTTGATARAEKYKRSRFAPIAFITKNRNSLNNVPAVLSDVEHANIFLESTGDELDFVAIGKQLRELGFERFLFEGGPSSLRQLLLSQDEVQLVLSVTNSDHSDEATADRDEPKQSLPNDLVMEDCLELKDDFLADQNRVTRWVKPAS